MTLTEQLHEKAKSQAMRIATAESCTGGLIAKLLTDTSGSSATFWGSAVCYDNSAKVELVQVSVQSLKEHGAVSETVAQELAAGILKKIPSTNRISLATTGIAGPTGATANKPVGMAWICVGIQLGNSAPTFRTQLVQSPHGLDREKNRDFFAESALKLALSCF